MTILDTVITEGLRCSYMPSKKNTAIIAVVAVVVLLAALFTFLRESGDDGADGMFIDSTVEVGDSYAFDTAQYTDGQLKERPPSQ